MNATDVIGSAGIQGAKAKAGQRLIVAMLASPNGKGREALARLGVQLAEVDPGAKSLEEIAKRLARAGMTATDAFDLVGPAGMPALLALVSDAATPEREA